MKIIAIAIGILVAGPFMIAALAQGFEGPLPELANDQNFYLARIQDVRDGYLTSGNAYSAEGKSALPMQFLTGEIVEAGILSALRLPTWASLILFPLLFVPLVVFLMYRIFMTLGAPRFFSVALSLMLAGQYFTALMRPISPQFNLIFWLLAAGGLLMIGKKPGERWVVTQALVVGALFYLYPYYWTHLVAAYGLLFLWYLVKDWATARTIAVAVSGAGLIALPYILLLSSARALPEYQESLVRLGFIATHTPSGVGILIGSIVLVAAVLYIAYRRRTLSHALIAALALVIGGLVAMNQHVITGINMEFSSHYALQIMFSNLFLGATAMTAFGFWQRTSGRWVRTVVVALVLVSLLTSVVPVYQAATRASAHEYTPLVEWLNTVPQGVVYAPEAVALFVPAYTHHDVFYARNANIAFMSDREVMDRFIVNNFRATIDADFIMTHEREIFGHHYINRYQHAIQKQKFLKFVGVHTDVPERISREAIGAVETRATELQSLPFSSAIAPYRVDYFIIDTSSPDRLVPADLAFAKLVFTAGRYEVFENQNSPP